MNGQVVVKNLLISYSLFNRQTQASRNLLFLHGWRSQKEIWNPAISGLISRLAYKPISCYTLDLPGFGSSQASAKPMTIGDYADVVKEFIVKLGLKNVIIVGHSFGGRIGIKLSSLNPELVRKLVLVDSAGFAMDASKKSL